MAKSTRSVVSLNGQWDLAFDPKNVGKKLKWFKRFPRSVKMQVPGVWEMVRPGYDGVGWYRRTFQSSAAWGGKTVRVKVGAASYFAECWLNGQYLGSHEGGYMPFEFDITRHLLAGRNELIVRIINPPINEELEGFRSGAPLNQGYIPIGKGGWYFNFGGLWQDVELIVTDKVYVQDIYVRPRPADKKAIVNVTVRNKSKAGKYDVTCRIAPRGAAKAEITKTVSVKLKKGDNQLELPLAFRKVRLWSPDDPHLYVATITVAAADGQRDEHSVRFGMREFTMKNGRFYLNGKKVKLVGFLHQGMYPRTLCYPETKDFARRELKMIKDGGFNFIRAHLKPPVPYYFDMCDEMGILVMAEPPLGWIGKSPHTERRCRTEMEGLLQRDRNHPCIVLWCLMNEAYHFRGFTMREIKAITTRMSRRGRQLDDTRLLADTSGGTGGHALRKGTKVWLPHRNRIVEIVDMHGYCPMPLEDSSIEWYRTLGRPGVLMLNSEYGAPDIPPNFSKVLAAYRPRERRLGYEDYVLHKDFYESLKKQFRKAGVAKIFGSVDKLIPRIDRVRSDEMRLVTMTQRANPRIAGLALCQYADASGELFGTVDVWRKPKKLWHAMSSAAQTPLIVPEVMPRVQWAGRTEAAIRAILVNDGLRGQTYNYRVEVRTAGGRLIKRIAAGKVRARDEVQYLIEQRVPLKLAPGKYNLRTALSRGGKVLSDQTMEFTALARPKAVCRHVAAYEPRELQSGRTLQGFFGKLGVQCDVFSHSYRNKNVPVLFDLRDGMPSRGMLREVFGQTRKFAQLGGCVVLFGADAKVLYEYLFPKLIRYQGVMRTACYVRPHPIFAGLPSGCVVGYEYAEVYPADFDKADDVVAAGGNVIFGGFSSHMWTRPAEYLWPAALYTVPVGKGHVIVCNLNVLQNLGTNPTADVLLMNLANYAASIIKRGGEKKLFSRCIDPLNPKDYF